MIQRLSQMCEATCVGVDISPKLIEIASGKYPNVEFRVGNILRMEDPDESFDVVLYSGVLHHFPEMDPVLEEGLRILKKGGCLLAFDPNQSNPAMWLYRNPASPLFSPVGKTENEILLDSGDALVGDMAMNDWYLRLTPGLPVLADDIHQVVQSWKKILPMGIKRIHPAHGRDFPVEVMQKEVENFK